MAVGKVQEIDFRSPKLKAKTRLETKTLYPGESRWTKSPATGAVFRRVGECREIRVQVNIRVTTLAFFASEKPAHRKRIEHS